MEPEDYRGKDLCGNSDFFSDEQMRRSRPSKELMCQLRRVS